MCGIAGFFHPNQQFSKEPSKYYSILNNMQHALRRRGPDDDGIYLNENAGLAHVRLSILDLETGTQPITRTFSGKQGVIVHNGEIYNMLDLKKELIQKGVEFTTASDTEVILNGLLIEGPDFVKKLNGIFAFAWLDPKNKKIYLFRDRSGIKPLFYTFLQGTLIFASELKALLQFPGIRAQVDINGLNEIFSIGPARTNGCGVFKHIHEILPGTFLSYDVNSASEHTYWKLESHPHDDSYEKTVEKTSFLLQDSIKKQMLSDVPVCTFLSGGIDSSIVSSVCARQLQSEGKQLTTFSFDFTDNQKYFHSSTFQPSQDRPYVEKMVKYLNTDHHYLECNHTDLADYLSASVEAHDLPCMADVDSSLLYFCSVVSHTHKVVLTGECADEIFGGYPWFHKKEFLTANTFPWTPDLAPRKMLLRSDFLEELQMDSYVKKTYEASVSETPLYGDETEEEKLRRRISWLNLRWFMQTLLNRMDRTSMYSGLEARVPFADHRMIEYLWNVPWEMKSKDGIVKGLLREAARGFVPDEILFRPKSPYPKTYDPAYESLLPDRLRSILGCTSEPINQFIDQKKVLQFLSSPKDYGKPWYGQLMAGPQMIAYLLQINEWFKKYHIEVLL